jgi:hypothetical protein
MTNEFGLLDFDWDAPLPLEERDQMLEKFVDGVRKWRMEVPLMLFLESTGPLSHIAGQGLVAFSPLVAPLLPSGIHSVQKIHKLLEKPENVQCLIDLLAEPYAARK